MSAQMAPVKPAFGDRCNGCGLCCLAESCEISVGVFGPNDRCPALSWRDGRFWCELAEQQQGEYGNLVAFLLGVGVGCDSDVPADTAHVARSLSDCAIKELSPSGGSDGTGKEPTHG